MTGEGSEPQKWRRYRPDKTPDPEIDSTPAPAPVSRPPKASSKASSKVGGDKAVVARRKRIGLAIAGAVGAAVIALIVWMVADAANPPRPQEVDGFNDFRADAKEEFGDQVYGLLVYEGYAFVEVPVAGGNHRSAKYSWRGGGFEDWTKNSGVTAPLFDIDDVDPVLFGRLCDEVRAVIDDGKDCYVSVEGPSGGTASEVGIRASISNDFSESASVTATLDGTIIDRYPPEE